MSHELVNRLLWYTNGDRWADVIATRKKMQLLSCHKKKSNDTRKSMASEMLKAQSKDDNN